jgi:hypothetical protein
VFTHCIKSTLTTPFHRASCTQKSSRPSWSSQLTVTITFRFVTVTALYNCQLFVPHAAVHRLWRHYTVHSTACSVSELRSEVKPSAEDVIRCCLFSTTRDRWYWGQWWTGGGRGVGRLLREQPASVSHFLQSQSHLTPSITEPGTARSEAAV